MDPRTLITVRWGGAGMAGIGKSACEQLTSDKIVVLLGGGKKRPVTSNYISWLLLNATPKMEYFDVKK